MPAASRAARFGASSEFTGNKIQTMAIFPLGDFASFDQE
jgi:hypothetical protein